MKTRYLLFTGQALDAATFSVFFLVVPATILAQMGVTEQNPLVAGLFAIGGFAAVVFAKIGLTSWVIWRDQRRDHRPKVTTGFMTAAAVSGYIGAAFNTLALMTFMAALP